MKNFLSSADISVFRGNQQLFLYQESQIWIASALILLTLFDSLKVVLIKMVAILMMAENFQNTGIY